VSIGPPAANGTTTVMGRSGNCAAAGAIRAADNIAPHAILLVTIFVIAFPP
jgi:hypothetical protein